MTRFRLTLISLALVVGAVGLLPSGASAAKIAKPGSVHSGVQAGTLRIKQQVATFDESNPVTFDGTIDKEGNVSVPGSGLHFPDTPISSGGFNLTVHILPGNSPPNPVTRTLDPLTGNVSLRLRLYVKIDGVPLASNCQIASASNPLDVNALISGTKPALGSNPAVTGAPYNSATGV